MLSLVGAGAWGCGSGGAIAPGPASDASMVAVPEASAAPDAGAAEGGSTWCESSPAPATVPSGWTSAARHSPENKRAELGRAQASPAGRSAR